FLARLNVLDIACGIEGRRGRLVARDVWRRIALLDLGRVDDVGSVLVGRRRIAREIELERGVGLDRVAFARGEELLEVRDHDRINERRAGGFQLGDILLKYPIDDLEIRSVRVGLVADRFTQNADARSIERARVEMARVASLDLADAKRG